MKHAIGIATIAALLLGMTANADTLDLNRTLDLNIPAQPLPAALIELSKQAQLQIMSRGNISQQTAPALTGHYTIAQALAQLLAGTNLQYSATGDNTIAVVPAADAASTGASGEPEENVMKERSNKPLTRLRLAQKGSQTQLASAQSQESAGSAAEEASEKVQEIIVTAQKRTERLQDVPISIAVLTAEDINRRGLVNSEDYLRGMPGVNQVANSFGQSIIIRGIETATEYQNYSSGAATGAYFGETPTTDSAGLSGSNVDIKLVDIERVEVLRGPQGTAFGNASMGGTVRVIPVAPKLDRVEGRVGAGYSTTSGTGGDNYMFQGVGNIPLIADKLAIRATAYKFEDSGYYRNRAGSDAAFQATIVPLGGQAFATDEDNVGAYRAMGGRASVLFQATEDLRFTLGYLTQKTEMDGYAIANSGPWDQTLLRVGSLHVRRGQSLGFSDTHVNIANAVVEYDLGWADVLGTYSDIRGGTTFAVPFTLYSLMWPASRFADLDHEGRVAELRLATKFSGPWNFLAGLYDERSKDSYIIPYDYWFGDPATNFFAPGTRFLDTYLDWRDLQQQAAFAEVSWQFLPGWTLTGGGRASRYDRTVQVDTSGPIYGASTSQRDEGEASTSTFRANLSYKPTENALLYAGWAQGFRLGKPQPEAPAGLCDKDNDGLFDGTNVTIASSGNVDSDGLDSYEVGGKFAFLDRRLSVDAAVFRMEWSNIPVSIRQNSACDWMYVANLGAALSEGFEVQANYRLTDAWRLDVGGSWLNARLTTDVPAQGFSAGDRLPASPKVNGNMALQYAFRLAGHQAFVRADAQYVGSFYGDIPQSPNLKAGDYVKVDATARIMMDSMSIDLFIRNLTDEDTFTSRGTAAPNAFFGYRPRPRTIGVQLGYQF